MSRIAVGALAVLLLAACSEPVATIPGGQLSGQEQDPPVLWETVPETVQVETRPTDPYSVNLWSVGIGADLYIATGADGTTWSRFISQDRSVKVRFGETLYPLHAARVEDQDERDRVAAAYTDKYDIDADDSWVARGLIFRLDRR